MMCVKNSARTIRIALPRGRRRGSRLDAFDLNHACHPRQCADCRPYNQSTAAHVQTGASPLQTAAHRTPPQSGLCDSPMLARCSPTCALRDALPTTAIGSRARARFPLWACGLHSLNAPDDEVFFCLPSRRVAAERTFDRPGRLRSVSFFATKKSRNIPKGCRVLGAC